MWTLQPALAVIQKLAPAVRACNYHVMLGGSVLHRGASDDDLDLFFMPLNGAEGNRDALFHVLNLTFGPLESLRDAPDYAEGQIWHWGELYKGQHQGLRVDLFIGEAGRKV
jgi:hypothetical protein